MKYSCIQKLVEIEHTPVNLCCQILGVSRSGYYKFLGSQEYRQQKQEEESRIITHLKAIWKRTHGQFGHRRIHNALPEDVQKMVSPKQVLRLMKECNMVPKRKEK